jgi:RHS repeat-associated protein
METSSTTEFGYRNEQRDADSGLIFLRARYYDPSTGTFISRDPFAGFQDSPLSLNEYIYGNSDPINRIDPTGESSTSTLSEQLVAFAVRNSLSILLATGFIVHKTNAAYQAGELSATKFLEIVAVEGVITVATGGLGGLIGKGLVYGKAVLNPATRKTFFELVKLTPGFDGAIQAGMNMPRVTAALQAMALHSSATTQRLVGGLPAVVSKVPSRGVYKITVVNFPGSNFSPLRAGIRSATGERLASELTVLSLSARSRIAANVPQFTAFVGRILFEFYERGESGEPPRIDIP